jgi:hypothetical protein
LGEFRALGRGLLFVRAKSNQKRAKTKVLDSYFIGEHLVAAFMP